MCIYIYIYILFLYIITMRIGSTADPHIKHGAFSAGLPRADSPSGINDNTDY